MLNTDRRVLNAIAELLAENRKRIIYDQIAERAIVSKNTVMNAVARLQEEGHLVTERPNSASPYQYRIIDNEHSDG